MPASWTVWRLLLIAAMALPIARAAPVSAGSALEPAATDTGAVRDGGFEGTSQGAANGGPPWQFQASGVRRSRERPHRGSYSARFCGEAGCDTRLAQVVVPPDPDGGSLLLVFEVRVETAKPPGGGCQDELITEVAIGSAEPETVGRLCEEVAENHFAHHAIDVTALARRAAGANAPLEIAFEARTDHAAASTTFWVDEIALVREPEPPGPANVRVSTEDSAADSEPHVAVDPADPNRLLAASKRFTDNARYRFRVGAFVSADGGRSWEEGGQLSGLDAFELTSDPVVAFGPDGVAYLAVMAVPGPFPGRDWGVFVYRSEDGGRTFLGPAAVDMSPGNDKPWLAVDTSDGPHRGAVYVVWTQAGTTYVSRSADGRRRFTPRQALLEERAAPGAQVAVGPDGTVYVLASSFDPDFPGDPAIERGPADHLFAVRFELRVSRDGGATFDPPRDVTRAAPTPLVLAGGIRSPVLPALAIAPDTGAILVALSDAREGAPDVWLSRSTDDGATFSEPLRVNDVAPNDQFQPVVDAGRHGTVVVGWFDRERDPANRLAEFVVARSVDGGASFGPPVRASTQRFDPALAAPRDDGGNRFFGDYQGLVLAGDVAIPIWNDPRTGLQRLYTVRLPLAALPTDDARIEFRRPNDSLAAAARSAARTRRTVRLPPGSRSGSRGA